MACAHKRTSQLIATGVEMQSKLVQVQEYPLSSNNYGEAVAHQYEGQFPMLKPR